MTYYPVPGKLRSTSGSHVADVDSIDGAASTAYADAREAAAVATAAQDATDKVAAIPDASTSTRGMFTAGRVKQLTQLGRHLSEFGATRYEPYTIALHGIDNYAAGGTNNPTAWALNDATFAAALLACAGDTLWIPAGNYYIATPWSIVADFSKVRCHGAGAVQIIYGPAWQSTHLHEPLVTVSNANPDSWISGVELSDILINGVYFVDADLLYCNRCSGPVLDRVAVGNSHVDYFGARLHGVQGLRSAQLASMACPFGVVLSAPNGVVNQQNFIDILSLNGYYKGLELESGNDMNLYIRACHSDLAPASVWGTWGARRDVATLDDVRGIHIKSAVSGIRISDVHLEQVGATTYGKAIECLVGSVLTVDNYTQVGFSQVRGGVYGANYLSRKTGEVQATRFQESMCRGVARWLGSPDNTCTWDAANQRVVTTTTTECTALFSFTTHQGSAPQILTGILVALNRGSAGYTAALDVVAIDHKAGGITQVATFTLAQEWDNSIQQQASGLLGTSSWDGWCGDTNYPGGDTTDSMRYEYAIRVRVTPGAGGAVQIRVPRYTYTLAQSKPTLT